ncbi:hypothetical protein NEPAR07_1192 [Nematocida parisii]|nr:hypothetical protein NEPAR07_1192 [Nematocida parisii]
MEEAHRETGHGGYEKIKSRLEEEKCYTWLGIGKDVKEWVKNCEKCQKNNQKRSIGRGSFIPTARKLELVGIDVMGPIEEHYVICMIDYHTRVAKLRAVKKHTTKEMIEAVEEWCRERGAPERVITDTAKEYIGKEWLEYLEKRGIVGHTGAVEVHGSLRRVERLIKSVWEIHRKGRDDRKSRGEAQATKEWIKEIERMINGRVHDGIKMRPEEAWNEEECEETRERLRERNSGSGEYARKRFEEEIEEDGELEKGAEVWIRKGAQRKQEDRFSKVGVVEKAVGGGSYIIRMIDSTEKKSKVNHRKIKKRGSREKTDRRKEDPGKIKIYKKKEEEKVW